MAQYLLTTISTDSELGTKQEVVLGVLEGKTLQSAVHDANGLIEPGENYQAYTISGKARELKLVTKTVETLAIK